MKKTRTWLTVPSASINPDDKFGSV